MVTCSCGLSSPFLSQEQNGAQVILAGALDLSITARQLDLVDVHRALHPTAGKHTFNSKVIVQNRRKPTLASVDF